MSQINPFTWVVQQGQVQQKQAATKERQVRRVQNLARNVALTGDQLEHQVESADAIRQAEDHDPNLPERRRAKQHKDKDEPPKLDIRA
ncbi:MAG: hypothetical protein ACHRHE_10635 [Tepidisphaerales bacterium]